MAPVAMCLLLLLLCKIALCMVRMPTETTARSASFLQLHGTPAAGERNASLKVAMMIVAPKGLARSDPGWHDAFAVLAHSVQQAAKKSSHTMDLMALVPNTLTDQKNEKAAFEKLGIQFKSVPIPVPLSHVKNPSGAEILKGALGEYEQLKYYGAAWEQYDRAVVMDADVIFLKPIDELLEATTAPYAASGVYDHEMDVKGSRFPPINTGFFVVVPNEKDFNKLVSIYRRGDIGGMGWEGSGTGWTYGTGSQGILSYFYNQVRPDAEVISTDSPTKGIDYPGLSWTKQPASSRFLPQDRSVYNVVDTQPLQQALAKGTTNVDRVSVFHFAGGSCPKPWTCIHREGDHLCDVMTQHWWKFRSEVAAARGLDASEGHCSEEGYVPLGLPLS